MSSVIKVFLLLAVMVCISRAQLNKSGKRCLCERVRSRISSKTAVKNIQIYQATSFCDKVEIIVTINSTLRYCLDPNLRIMQKIMSNILRKQRTSTTARPTELTSTPGSTETARI